MFRNFPDSKGIKTFGAFNVSHDLMFRNFPDSKGIKTLVDVINSSLYSLETSLTPKGLRLSYWLLPAILSV